MNTFKNIAKFYPGRKKTFSIYFGNIYFNNKSITQGTYIDHSSIASAHVCSLCHSVAGLLICFPWQTVFCLYPVFMGYSVNRCKFLWQESYVLVTKQWSLNAHRPRCNQYLDSTVYSTHNFHNLKRCFSGLISPITKLQGRSAMACSASPGKNFL